MTATQLSDRSRVWRVVATVAVLMLVFPAVSLAMRPLVAGTCNDVAKYASVTWAHGVPPFAVLSVLLVVWLRMRGQLSGLWRDPRELGKSPLWVKIVAGIVVALDSVKVR